MIFILAITFVFVLFSAWKFYSLKHTCHIRDRLLFACVPLGFYYLVMLVCYESLRAPAELWNNVRITPLVAFTRGYEMYYPGNEGAILNTIYPPLAYLAFAPAALSDNQDVIVIVGSMLAKLYYTIPFFSFAFLFSRKSEPQASISWCGAVVVAGMVLTYLSPPLSVCFQFIHGDAPALFFASAACYILIRRCNYRMAYQLPAAGLAVAASVWSKQTMAPMLVALPIWLWLQKPLDAIWMLFWMAAFGTILWGIFSILIAPTSVLWFNLVELPAQHPWKGEFPGNVLYGAGDLFLYAIPLIMVIVLGMFVCEDRRAAWSVFRPGRPEMLLVLVAFILSITCIPGYVKVGGFANNYGPPLYFLCLANMGMFFHFKNYLNINRLKLLTTIATAIMLCAFGLGLRLALELAAPIERYHLYLAQFDQGKAHEYISHHPGQGYFINFPLTHLLAEGVLVHYDYALYDRWLAGNDPTRQHLDDHFPGEMKVLFLSPVWRKENTRDWNENWGFGQRGDVLPHYLPSYDVPVDIDGFDGWLCLSQSSLNEQPTGGKKR